MKINVMGVEYEIIFEEKGTVIEEQVFKSDEYDGYIDFTSKRIYITDLSEHQWENIDDYKNKVIRHEIVHAFLYESGLDVCSWGEQEEIVDWIALQSPKLLKAFEDLKLINI